jgi:hypothetical protein
MTFDRIFDEITRNPATATNEQLGRLRSSATDDPLRSDQEATIRVYGGTQRSAADFVGHLVKESRQLCDSLREIVRGKRTEIGDSYLWKIRSQGGEVPADIAAAFGSPHWDIVATRVESLVSEKPARIRESIRAIIRGEGFEVIDAFVWRIRLQVGAVPADIAAELGSAHWDVVAAKVGALLAAKRSRRSA